MSFGIVAGVVGAVGAVASANAQRSAAKKAANAQRETSDAQIALQREQMARAEQVAKPYREAGAASDQRLRDLWNYDPSDPYAQGYSGRYNPGGAYGGRPGMGSAAPVFMAGAP